MTRMSNLRILLCYITSAILIIIHVSLTIEAKFGFHHPFPWNSTNCIILWFHTWDLVDKVNVHT